MSLSSEASELKLGNIAETWQHLSSNLEAHEVDIRLLPGWKSVNPEIGLKTTFEKGRQRKSAKYERYTGTVIP